MSGPSPAPARSAEQTDALVLGTVDGYLRQGLALKRWYDRALPGTQFAEVFDLARTANRPDRSFGFFDKVRMPDGDMSVMGNYQEMLYDQPRGLPGPDPRSWWDWREQVREFVLHYFMRISSFTRPEASASTGYPDPSLYRGGLSWCPGDTEKRLGFGFSQLYYKLRDTGEIFRFPEHERFAIVDLRDIGVKYEWVVLKVRIFDFSLSLQPFGPDTPQVVLELNESSYLVVTQDFITDAENPAPGVMGRYGFGYAFIHNPIPDVAAYGPGEFDAAYEEIVFEVADNGAISVRMAFVANRPHGATRLELKPVEFGFRVADLFSLGLASRFFASVKNSLNFSLGTIDPLYLYIRLANLVTANQAADMLCISREQLDRRFLLQHFTQHYETVIGSLMTWRQIRDWRDARSLPAWVVSGGLIHD
jgi:hypothetical protein